MVDLEGGDIGCQGQSVAPTVAAGSEKHELHRPMDEGFLHHGVDQASADNSRAGCPGPAQVKDRRYGSPDQGESREVCHQSERGRQEGGGHRIGEETAFRWAG